MIVRKGITSFFQHRTIPEFSFGEFKDIVRSCVAPIGFTIHSLTERGVTPNFHTAALERFNDQFTILAHSTYPIIAFAEPLKPGICELRFRDANSIAKRITDSYPNVTIASTKELLRRIDISDIEQLNRAEREQIKYWKPQTIGELAFNWWD